MPLSQQFKSIMGRKNQIKLMKGKLQFCHLVFFCPPVEKSRVLRLFCGAGCSELVPFVSSPLELSLFSTAGFSRVGDLPVVFVCYNQRN